MALFQSALESIIKEVSSLVMPLEKLGVDVDDQPSVLKLSFPDGRVYLLNTYESLHQVWLSSPKSGGWRFSYDDDVQCWLDTRTGRELISFLKEDIGAPYFSCP